MADFPISSLQGGLNEDPPLTIPDNCCVAATNVEFVRSPLGERRRGSDAIDLTGSDLEDCDKIVWTHRHMPTTDPKAAQLWVLGLDGSTPILAYKDTSWHTVTMSDALTVDGVSEYQVKGLSLHGKLFIAYNSAVDRLHVWDGTNLRRTGLAEPAAPTSAETGSAGTYAGVRHFRVRYVVMSGTTVLRRSEPSDALIVTPSGTKTGTVVTKPASISESETHWELEASDDEGGNFYRIARTVVGTTTVTDTTDISSGYRNVTGAVLSEDIGDYALIPSVRYLSADEDRLMAASSFEDAALASRVMWTPVLNSPGDGNDERLESDTDPSVDLDNYEGGRLVGLSAATNGYLFAMKQSHTYQLSRRGVRAKAYEAILLTGQRGAIEGSIVDALDNLSNPTVFFLDGDVGPCVVTPRGVEPCGADLAVTWDTVNIDATKVAARGLYYRENKQVQWWVATGASNVPDRMLVLHTKHMRRTDEGLRGGWVTWTSEIAEALTVCMFADNIDDDTDRSNVLVPFIGREGDGLVWRTNTGDDDNGTAFSARILTKPFVRGSLLNEFEVKSASLAAKAATGAVLDVTLIGSRADEAEVSEEVSDISLTAGAGEGSRVIRHLDDLSLAELNAVQVEFEDSTTPGGRWELDLMVWRDTAGQRA